MTYSEKKIIKILEDLGDNWNENYWLYAVSGELTLMKKNSEGKRAMGGMNAPDGVDQAYIVDGANIKIECDGGGW